MELILEILIYVVMALYSESKILKIEIFKDITDKNLFLNILVKVILFIITTIVIFSIPAILVSFAVISDKKVVTITLLVCTIIYFPIVLGIKLIKNLKK